MRPSLGTDAAAVNPVVIDAAQERRRRRRPSGEPPPLPRDLRSSGRLMLALVVLVLGVLTLVALIGSFGSTIDRFDRAILQWFSSLRSSALTPSIETLENFLSSEATSRVLRWAILLLLVVFRRFRHLFVFLGSVLLVGWVTTTISVTFVRARPIGIDILGHWQGASVPSKPTAALAATLICIAYALVVPGRPRDIAKWATYAIIAVFALIRLYLGIDHLTDLVFGVIFGLSIPVIAFRTFAPSEAFPVAYRRGRTAHLDIEGPRGAAIRKALEEQLGLTILDMRPFGLEGSGGSTPIRLHVTGEVDGYLFAKLYAANHLRADRWYKLGRTLLYGRLEDESTFSSVRRLVQYEDYMLRVMRDAGLNTPIPYGFVEITPEREYLLVTEFIDGGAEITKAEVNEGVMERALSLVRQLWDGGLAHRDIKPSNILVRDGNVYLIDVAFGEVRPSPWRQAVDLANMMIVLAFCSDPDTVYRKALLFFTAEEIAEAFAATHSVTIPSQSRSMLKQDAGGRWSRLRLRRRKRRDTVDRFRELAPERPLIKIQSWSLRRVATTVGVCLVFLMVVDIGLGNLGEAGLLFTPVATESSIGRVPECDRFNGEQLVLVAQSVPSASMLPCVDALPLGWSFRTLDVRDGSSVFHMDSDRGGDFAVEVSLARTCNTSGATRIPSDEAGTTRFERIDTLGSAYSGSRFYVFPGGCVTYHFRFTGEGRTSLANEASVALSFISREDLSDQFFEQTRIRF